MDVVVVVSMFLLDTILSHTVNSESSLFIDRWPPWCFQWYSGCQSWISHCHCGHWSIYLILAQMDLNNFP